MRADGMSGTPLEVLWVFLRLGLTSFGGPVAHIGYFRAELVNRRQWIGDRGYSELVALCQFLPGPTSSQVGMAIGLHRAGWMGALAAWSGFTLPSACLLILFAYGIREFSALTASGAVHGLKVVAVAVVAQAVTGMARSLCPDGLRAFLAILAASIVLFLSSPLGQVAALAACALLGWLSLRLPQQEGASQSGPRVSRTAGCVALVLYFALLIAPALGPTPVSGLATGLTSPPDAGLVGGVPIEGFYRAGALVFGGGHVVLPLLQAVVVPTGLISNAEFLAGYGAAQAVPGPLFSFAAFVGTLIEGPLRGWPGGLVFLGVIFLPGMLILVGILPFWDVLRRSSAARNALAGVNAGVVGILLAALYDPVFLTAIRGAADLVLAIAAFALLVFARVSPVIVVALGAAAGWCLEWLPQG